MDTNRPIDDKWGFFTGLTVLFLSPFMVSMGLTGEKWYWVVIGVAIFPIVLILDGKDYVLIAKASSRNLYLVLFSVFLIVVHFAIPIFQYLLKINLAWLAFISILISLGLVFYFNDEYKRICKISRC